MFSGHQQFTFCLLFLILTEVFHSIISFSSQHLRDVGEMGPWCTVVQGTGPAWSREVLGRVADI